MSRFLLTSKSESESLPWKKRPKAPAVATPATKHRAFLRRRNGLENMRVERGRLCGKEQCRKSGPARIGRGPLKAGSGAQNLDAPSIDITLHSKTVNAR